MGDFQNLPAPKRNSVAPREAIPIVEAFLGGVRIEEKVWAGENGRFLTLVIHFSVGGGRVRDGSGSGQKENK